MGKNGKARERRDNAGTLRQAAGSKSAKSYRMEGPQGLRTSSSGRKAIATGVFSSWFGGVSPGESWHHYVASAIALSPMGFACLLLIIVLNVLQQIG